MDAAQLLDLFDRLAAETASALGHLDDWGPSGDRLGQYRHDVVADEIIRRGLRSAGLAVLSEESGLAGPGGASGVTVVVDPVDGSTNGARGLPWYATSLCAVDGDGPLAALVVNLATGDRYRAVRGRGAEHDRSAIRVGGAGGDGGGGRPPDDRVSPPPRPVVTGRCRELAEAIIGVSGLPPGPVAWRQFRALGAIALDLCAVADGNLDGYVDVDRAHGVWDYLGAVLVCREAGATVVDGGGDELVVLDPDARRAPIAGSTPELVEQLTAMVAGWSGPPAG